MYQPLQIDIRLSELICHERGSSRGEPYLWTVFFKIDGEAIQLTDNFRIEGQCISHVPEASQGNLQARHLHNDSRLSIPQEYGSWKTRLEPIIIPHFEAQVSGTIVLISVLMEAKQMSPKGARAAHQVFSQELLKSVNETLAEFDPRKVNFHQLDRSIEKYFVRSISRKSENIKKKIVQAVQHSQSLGQNLWTLLGKDIRIGQSAFTFSQEEIWEQGLSLDFQHKWTNRRTKGCWELKGRIKAKNLTAFITSCCKDKKKDARPLPAIERYLDARISEVYERSKRQNSHFLIFSGKYGLLEAEEEIEYYDLKLEEQDVEQAAEQLALQLQASGLQNLHFVGKLRDPSWQPYIKALQQASAIASINLKMTEYKVPKK